jgi:hypothetical protein
MSFAENLHDRFELVHSHSISRRKGVSDLISFLEEKAAIEDSYAKGLERVVKSPYLITNQGTLAHAILALKNDSLNKAMQARTLSENILKDLANPLKDLLSNQLKTLSKTHPEGKKSENKRQELVERLERFKARYMKACKESETLTVQLETPQPSSRRDKMMQRVIILKQDIEENLKGYKDALAQHNEYKEKFTDFMSKILEVYQKQEEQRLETMKDCLRKLVIYETSYLRNLQYDIDNLAKAIESVNCRSDIQQFIDENSSSSTKNLKFEFESYSGTHETFKNIGSEPPSVKIPMNSSLSAITSISNKTSAEEIIKSELSFIVSKVLNAESSASAEDLTKFSILAKDSLARRGFASILNDFKSKPLLQEQAFHQMVGFINIVLTEADFSNDVPVFKMISNVVRCYKMENGEMTVLDVVKNHGIWKKLDMWDHAVLFSINEDIKWHEQFREEAEGREDKEKRLKNLVFCQLGTYATLIPAFGVDVKYVAELISKYSCRFELAPQDTETLLVFII